MKLLLNVQGVRQAFSPTPTALDCFACGGITSSMGTGGIIPILQIHLAPGAITLASAVEHAEVYLDSRLIIGGWEKICHFKQKAAFALFKLLPTHQTFPLPDSLGYVFI